MIGLGFIGKIIEGMKNFFVPVDRYPRDLKAVESKALGGQPMFYNEIDHTRGRFINYLRYESDKADTAKVLGNFYRLRLRVDAKIFWIIPASRELITPCCFRPDVDSVFRAPGEADGVPPEGIVVIRRSLDGQNINNQLTDRYLDRLKEQKFVNALLVDSLNVIRDKERLQVVGDASKEASDEMETRMRRLKKVQDATTGKGEGTGFGSPYGNEMFGQEDVGANPLGGPDNSLWRFEG